MASVKVIYLVLVDKRANIGCIFKYQLTRPPLNMKIKPKINFQLFLSFVQSKSEYSFTNSLLWPLQMIFHLFEPFIYYKIIFTVLVYQQPRFFIKQLAIKVAKAILSFVSTIKNMKDPIIPWQQLFFDGNAFFSVFYLRSAISFIRVLTAWALSR